VVEELAYLVRDFQELHTESLKWQEIWIKVSCRNPKEIKGTTEVYFNLQGHWISWALAGHKPPNKPSGERHL
jgi:hypothetical protein